VAGVGDEGAHLFLAGLAGGQGRRDVAEHPVDGGAHLAHLGARVGVFVGHALGERDLATFERQLGDARGRGDDALERAQGYAHDRRSHGEGRHEPGERHEGDHDEHLRDRGTHLGE
jgi:hypothetical protein